MVVIVVDTTTGSTLREALEEDLGALALTSMVLKASFPLLARTEKPLKLKKGLS